MYRPNRKTWVINTIYKVPTSLSCLTISILFSEGCNQALTPPAVINIVQVVLIKHILQIFRDASGLDIFDICPWRPAPGFPSNVHWTIQNPFCLIRGTDNIGRFSLVGLCCNITSDVQRWTVYKSCIEININFSAFLSKKFLAGCTLQNSFILQFIYKFLSSSSF